MQKVRWRVTGQLQVRRSRPARQPLGVIRTEVHELRSVEKAPTIAEREKKIGWSDRAVVAVDAPTHRESKTISNLAPRARRVCEACQDRDRSDRYGKQ
ncbi:hypothetical protein ACFONL_14275 [Camelimonas fluminis]|uniref:Uncharacterized protein n=1 Tax=Camelimonas fluminis TaxID=1576911 RepID=A0ABV7UJ30_9HYPH